MRIVELFTNLGERVATVELPPYRDTLVPQVVMWHGRAFKMEDNKMCRELRVAHATVVQKGTA